MKRLALLLVLVPLCVQAQQQPTPMRPVPKPAYDQTAPAPARPPPRATGSWQRFNGATRCEQFDRRLSCDNGYSATVR